MRASIFSLAAMMLAGGTALAQQPTQADLDGAKVVEVQPVFTLGLSETSAWNAIAGLLSMNGTVNKLGDAGTAILSRGGFGFAGASTRTDVAALQYGVMAGATLIVHAKDPELLKKLGAVLQAGRDDVAGLSPDVTKVLDGLVAAAVKGQTDTKSLAYLMLAAQNGIAAGPQRLHGYLMAGLWSSMALWVATMEGVPKGYASMAEPLAVMLDEDAKFGGSDRKLATHLRAMAAELMKKERDLKVLGTHFEAIRNTKPDRPEKPPVEEPATEGEEAPE